MVSGIDGVGEAVTGGMLARAVEPEAGEHAGEVGGACLNCGALLEGPYCKACGQKAHVHRSVGAIAHDLIHGVLHLDGKFWRTLPLLAWRPGDLTRRYAHGERAKFVSPMAMFLFSIFLMFATLSIFDLSLSNLDVQFDGDTRTEIVLRHNQIRQQLTAAQTERARLGASDPRRTALDRRIAALSRDERSAEAAERFAQAAASGEPVQTGWSRLDHGIKKFGENPGLALYKLQSNGYKFSWLLIPLSVPFVWALFFWTRRYHFYDHTVFVTYSLAFMSLLAVLLTILSFAGVPGPALTTAALLVPPVHMFRQLKQAYQLHWASALVRTFLLLVFCTITASLFFVLLLGIGALG
ncbi:MAG TPA: DUF3667 domain-containing protein [Allosphingosinicella sp.]|nr:DUF3667 domain-containing protein [Allosphingosinicella sp.]